MAVPDTKPRVHTPCKPLSAPARFTLLLSTAATVSLLYMFCAAAVIAVVAMILFDLCVGVVALRFPWLLKYVTKPIEALGRLCRAVVGSLVLDGGTQYRIPLSPGDALDLHYAIRRIANKIGVTCPREVFVDMSDNAYVELRGYRRGGYSVLCLGYDLLVGLDKAELESVIAHELAHAKLTQRVYRRWLAGGMSRISRLYTSTSEIVAESARQKKKFYLASAICKAADSLGRIASRLFATYSREDEFAADYAAAATCGANIAREALLRLSVIDHALSSISWRDRVARTQRGGSFSGWLESVVQVDDKERADVERRALELDRTGDYDSHPSLSDRLAALPDEPHIEHSAAEPAIRLLTDPDGIGIRLIDEIERLAVEEQRKHSRWTEKRARGSAGDYKYSGVQTILIMLALFFCGAIVFVWVAGESLDHRPLWLTRWVIGAAACICALRKWRPRERLSLPAPPASIWITSDGDQAERSDGGSWLGELQSQLVAGLPAGLTGKKQIALHWAEVSYGALGQCDYRRALAAAELCLKADRQCQEGLIAHSIAHKYYHHYDICSASLNQALAKHNVRGSLALALGWLWGISERWEDAEGCLLLALKDRPKDAGLLSMLAHCHAMNEKFLEAADRARAALELEPNERSYREQLMQLLMSNGRTREACEHLDSLEASGELGRNALVTAIHTHLMLDNTPRAEGYAARLLEAHSGGQTLLDIGRAYAYADLDEIAAGYYEKAAEAGHWPSAYARLSRMEYDRKNYDKAKELLAAALDVTRDIATDADHPCALVPAACQGMSAMREPIDGCSVWTATVSLQDSPAEVDAVIFTVVESDARSAEELVKWVYSAMHPGKELSSSLVKWKRADENEQPTGMIAPGIYGVEWK